MKRIITTDDILQDRTAAGLADPRIRQEGTSPEADKQDHSVWDYMREGFKSESAIYNWWKRPSIGDENKPMRNAESIWPDIPARHWDKPLAYAYSQNKEDSDQVTRRLDEIDESRRIAAEGGLKSLPGMLAAGMDPTIMFGWTVAYRAGRLGNALRGAMAGAGSGAAAIGVQEAILQGSQPQRGFNESLSNILYGAAFAGVFGGAVGAMSKRNFVRRTMEDVINDVQPEVVLKRNGDSISVDSVTTPKSAGAAATKIPDDVRLARINESLAAALSGPKAMQSVSLRGLLSPVYEVAEIHEGLFKHGYILKGHLQGRSTGPSVELLMSKDMADMKMFNSTIKQKYLDYVNETSTVKAFVNAEIRGTSKSFTNFSEEVAFAMRRGDVHSDPNVAAIAKAGRSVVDHWAAKLQEVGLLGEKLDVATAKSYLTRAWDKQKIIADYPNLIKRLRASAIKARKQKHPGFVDKNGKPIDDLLLDQKVMETRDLLVNKHHGDGELELNMIYRDYAARDSKPSFTKNRLDWLEDADYEDLLVNDGIGIVNAYAKQASAIYHTTKKLRELGYDSVTDMYNTILTKGAAKAEGMAAKERQAFLNAIRGEADLAVTSINIVLGKYGARSGFDRALSYLRQYNALRHLGAVTFSSLPDMAMPVFMHGLGRTMRGWNDMLLHKKAWTKNADDLKAFDVGLELEGNALVRVIIEGDTATGIVPKRFQQFADVTTEGFFKINMMSYWNNSHKRLAGTISMNRTVRALKEWKRTGKMSEKETIRLARMNIDKSKWKKILDQIEEHGFEEDGVWIMNLRNWTDDDALQTFGLATKHEVDNTILTPSLGDVPEFVATNQIGKSIFQYKSFQAAATSKILISGLQRRDKEVLAGLVGLLTIGGLLAQTYRIAKHKEPLTPAEFIKEGISRSGMAGLLMDNLIGFIYPQGFGRYVDRSRAGILLGPTFSMVPELGDLIDEINAADGPGAAKAAGRFLPVQNLLNIRRLLEYVNDENR